MKNKTNNTDILLNINTNKINKNFINTNNTSKNKPKPEKKLDKKKEALKLLKNIGIDTRYISYNENTIYINDQRFSKFSKNRQKAFKKHYPEVEIISSNLFQKICIRASKILSKELSPKDKILIFKPENNADNLLKIILEPYSRKYRVKIIESEMKSSDSKKDQNIPTSTNPNIKLNINRDINIIAKSLTLDEKVEDILSNIFSGNGIGNINTKQNNKKIKIIYPFINITSKWIKSFNKKTQENNKNKTNSKKTMQNNAKNHENKEDPYPIIAKSFMKSLESIIPQHKENLLKSAIFIENKLNNKKK